MEKNTGIKRWFYASEYSLRGFRSALANETAFQQELFISLCLTVATFFFDITSIERLALIGTLILILITEILNSAIECVVDRISEEHHLLSGRAKDYGSFAVFLSLLLAAITWLTILF